MANNCYNLFDFYGNNKVKQQVKVWKEALANVAATKEDPYCMLAVIDVFYPNIKDKNSIDMGSKWAHEDDASIGPDEDQIGLLSAWNPPHELHKHMACLLFKLDKHVVVQNSFNIEDGSQGVAYATPNDEESAYFQSTHVELDADDFEDSDDALDAQLANLEENQIEILDYLMDDMPGTAKVIKKHKKYFSDKFDWTKYD